MLKGLSVLLIAAGFSAAGCDYNNDGPALPDATLASSADGSLPPPTLDAGRLLDAQSDAYQPDASDAAALTNESFESAYALGIGKGVLQDIVHSEQTNYFSFDTTAPGFFELRTNNGDFSPDVLLSLYNGAQTMIAQNDSGSLWPGDAIDARLVVYLPAAGRYYAEVYDPSTPPDYFEGGSFSLRFYRLDLRALEAGAAGVAYRSAQNLSAVNFAQDTDTAYSYATVVGVMEPGAVDGFSITGKSQSALIGHVLASGTMGNSSTALPGPVRVLSQTDMRLLGEVDGTPSHLQLFPPISDGLYELRVAVPENLVGNAFYAIDLVQLPDNPRERAEAANGTPAGAEPIMLAGASQRRGLLLSDVVGGDVDYYSFTAVAGASALVSCEGQDAGSGVRALHVELRDGSDRTLTTAVESATHDLDISSFTLPAQGTYYVRLSSDHVASPEEAEPWVRCVVLVAP